MSDTFGDDRINELEAAYLRTYYRVTIDKRDSILRAGRRNLIADARLRTAGIHGRWSIVTPCNPGSRNLAAAENQDRLVRFMTELPSLGAIWLPSVNHDPSGRWPDEPGALLGDVSLIAVTDMARHWGQDAIITSLIGYKPYLLYV